MPALRDFPNLEGLDISCDTPRITHLYAYGSRLEVKVTDTGLAALQGLPLTKLSLKNRNLITDAGLESLRGMPLTELDISDCAKLTDAGMDVVRAMPLVRLGLSGRTKVSLAVVEELRGNLREIAIAPV